MATQSDQRQLERTATEELPIRRNAAGTIETSCCSASLSWGEDGGQRCADCGASIASGLDGTQAVLGAGGILS